MSSHTETRILPYPAELMFDVVADVERYPEFLPWCTGLRVLSRAKEGENDILIAEMLVGYRALRERYTSRVVLDRKNLSIDVAQTKGPFARLGNHWRFVPKATGCEVTFRIDFEFKNRMLNMVAGQAFEHVLFKMADAFETRAKALLHHPEQQV